MISGLMGSEVIATEQLVEVDEQFLIDLLQSQFQPGRCVDLYGYTGLFLRICPRWNLTDYTGRLRRDDGDVFNIAQRPLQLGWVAACVVSCLLQKFQNICCARVFDAVDDGILIDIKIGLFK